VPTDIPPGNLQQPGSGRSIMRRRITIIVVAVMSALVTALPALASVRDMS